MKTLSWGRRIAAAQRAGLLTGLAQAGPPDHDPASDAQFGFLLWMHYFAQSDYRARRRDGYFALWEGEPLTAIGVLARLAALSPHLSRMTFERQGATCEVRHDGRVHRLEIGAGGDIAVHDLVEVCNEFLRTHSEQRLLPLIGPGSIEAYVLVDRQGATALDAAGLLEDALEAVEPEWAGSRAA